MAAGSSGLVAYWKMNEGSGTTLVDDSGFGNNGTLLGSPVWVTGKAGSALKLDGTTQYATVANAASLNISSAITLAVWIRPEKLAAQKIIAKYSTGVDGYSLIMLSTGKVTFQFNQFTSTTTKLNSNTLYPTDGVTWMHVAATYDGAIIKIYINGVLDKSVTLPATPINTNTLPVLIGQESGGTGIFKGTMDDARIYNYALTSTEVSGLFNNPSAMSGGRIASNSHSKTLTEVLSNVEDFGVSAYPNPANEVLFLEFNGVPENEFSITIADPLGRVYLRTNTKVENNKLEIKLSDLSLSDGMHLLLIKSEGYSKVIKFIKK